MALSINGYLKDFSAELFIKYKSAEREKIDRSISNIFTKIEEHFGDEVSEISIFGSYSRDTILPRKYDDQSDIDILIEFNTEDYDKLKPESYRSKLLKFANNTYPKSLVGKDHPAIVVELNFIKYDLVPCIFDEGIIWDSIEIPDKDGGWMETEPDKFSEKLTEVNKRYNSIVKPVIRLLKYWNARHGYPYASYDLEKKIADMDFSDDNHESGFFYAIDNLPTSGLASWAKPIVSALKENAESLDDFLKEEDALKADKFLLKILPNPIK